jgi:3-(3-hydroxy-phenyl)propionate hydroxylase
MQFAFKRSPDQDAATPARHRVAIIGAGPVGLTLAIDLAQRGVASVLLDDNDRIGDGSRAICFAKRTLEIFDRLGIADKALAKGVQWQKGRVFLYQSPAVLCRRLSGRTRDGAVRPDRRALEEPPHRSQATR